MIKAVIFDFFDVLAVDGERQFFEKYIEEGSQQDTEASALGESLMSGKIDYTTYRQKLAEITGLALDEVGRWLDNNQVNESLFEYIRTHLKPTYKLAIISNAGDDWVSDMLGEANAALFDEVTLSFREKSMKPEPHIYQVTLQKLGILAEEAVFTDDKERYVDAAKTLGMHGIVFRDTEQFIQDFSALEAANV